MISLAISLTHDPTDGWYTLRQTTSTFVREGLPSDPSASFGHGASVNGAIAFSQTLRASGDTRPGYLDIQFEGSAMHSYSGTQSLSIGIANGTVANQSVMTAVSCYQEVCIPGASYYSSSLIQPLAVTLGVDVPLFVTAQIADSAIMGVGISGGAGSSSYRFRFTELNGDIVPLTTVTPEPAALGLYGMLLLGLYALRRRRRAT